jgi:hypothetical protein
MALRKTQSGIVGAALLADARLRRGLEAAQGDIYGPVCDLCNAVVDSEEIVDGVPGFAGIEKKNKGAIWTQPNMRDDDLESTWEPASRPYCKVLVKHHGCEELHTFDMESTNWTVRDLKIRMQQRRWFSPLEAGHGEGTLFSAGGTGK